MKGGLALSDQNKSIASKTLERPEGKMNLSDKIYRTPTVYITALSAAAGVAFCVLLTLILLIFGLRIHSDKDLEGNRIRYFGIMSRGEAVFGIIYRSDGTNGYVTGETIRFSDGTKYKGDIDGLLFEGEGSFTDKDGNVYSGNFVNGRLEGEGRITYADGSSFTGTFVSGKQDGYGEYVGADGSSYKGYHANGEKSGYGEFIYPDGSVYSGYFQNGMRHGEGTYRFASGDNYTGEFRNNVIWGSGSYFFTSGRVFSGEFHNGAPVLE